MTFTRSNQFMWLFDAHEFIPESHFPQRHHYVAIMKVGGGTVGRRYEGSWLFTVMDTRNGRELSRGQMDSDTPVTHEEMAMIVNAEYRGQ